MCRGVLDAYFLQHVHGNEGCMCVRVFTNDIINYLQYTLKDLNFAFQERYPRFLAITAFIISVQQRAPAYRR